MRSPEKNLERIGDAFASIAGSYARMAECSEKQLEIATQHLVISQSAVEATQALEAQLKATKENAQEHIDRMQGKTDGD